MATSRTPKKHKNKINKKVLAKAKVQAATETVAEILHRLLNHWSNIELEKLSRSTTLVCIEVADNLYRVGKFNLHKRNNNSWVVSDLDDTVVHDFCNQQAAVFYCLYETKKLYHKANDFLFADRDLGTLRQEANYLEYRLKRARQNNDGWAEQLYIARLSWVRPRLELLQTNLQKTITAAKYTKSIWEPKP